MSETKFNARKTLSRLNEILAKYDNECLSLYNEETYIADIIFFIGKSIDKDQYGHDAKTFRDFLAKKIYPMADAARTSAKKQFARELGMKT